MISHLTEDRARRVSGASTRRHAATMWFAGFLAGFNGHPKSPEHLADDLLDLLDNLQ